jgi:uncharacterized protein
MVFSIMLPSFPEPVQRALAYLLRQLGAGSRLELFGSRARGTARPTADFDVALHARAPLSWIRFAALKSAAEELAWLWKLDLIDLDRAPEAFRRIVELERVVIEEVADDAVVDA